MQSRVLAIGALLALGCTAVRYPEPVIGQREPSDRPILGVQPPIVRLDQEQPLAPHELSAGVSEREIEQATRVIHALRNTGLFREVDFTCSLSAPPSVAVEIESPPQGTGSFDRWWLWFITAGLVPVTETHEEGIYFKILDGASSFSFDWSVDHVVGWAALPLSLSPHWHFDRTMSLFGEALSQALQSRSPQLFHRDHWLLPAEARQLRSACR